MGCENITLPNALSESIFKRDRLTVGGCKPLVPDCGCSGETPDTGCPPGQSTYQCFGTDRPMIRFGIEVTQPVLDAANAQTDFDELTLEWRVGQTPPNNNQYYFNWSPNDYTTVAQLMTAAQAHFADIFEGAYTDGPYTSPLNSVTVNGNVLLFTLEQNTLNYLSGQLCTEPVVVQTGPSYEFPGLILAIGQLPCLELQPPSEVPGCPPGTALSHCTGGDIPKIRFAVQVDEQAFDNAADGDPLTIDITARGADRPTEHRIFLNFQKGAATDVTYTDDFWWAFGNLNVIASYADLLEYAVLAFRNQLKIPNTVLSSPNNAVYLRDGLIYFDLELSKFQYRTGFLCGTDPVMEPQVDVFDDGNEVLTNIGGLTCSSPCGAVPCDTPRFLIHSSIGEFNSASGTGGGVTDLITFGVTISQQAFDALDPATNYSIQLQTSAETSVYTNKFFFNFLGSDYATRTALLTAAQAHFQGLFVGAYTAPNLLSKGQLTDPLQGFAGTQVSPANSVDLVNDKLILTLERSRLQYLQGFLEVKAPYIRTGFIADLNGYGVGELACLTEEEWVGALGISIDDFRAITGREIQLRETAAGEEANQNAQNILNLIG